MITSMVSEDYGHDMEGVLWLGRRYGEKWGVTEKIMMEGCIEDAKGRGVRKRSVILGKEVKLVVDGGDKGT